MNGQTRLTQAGTLVLAALLIFSLGFLIGKIAAGAGEQSRQSSRITHERLKEFDLTNPLLECEGGGDTIGNRALRPFKDKLAGIVDRIIRSGQARQVSVYFRDLNNGPWYGINEDLDFSSAGLFRIPLAMAVMREFDSDPSVLQRAVKDTMQEDRNASTAHFLPAGTLVREKAYSIDELLEIMLTRSDDDATALLAHRVKPDIAAGIFSDLGVPAPVNIDEIALSVRSFATFFRVLYNASYLTKSSSEHVLSLLSRSSFRSGIAAGVPHGVPVADNYGEKDLGPDRNIRELHDCGIVYYPNSPYLLCVMTRGSSFEGNAAVIQEISRLVFSIVDAHESGKAWGN